MELDFSMDPVERLKLEMDANKAPLAQAIGKYLLEQFTLDSGLKNAYFERKIYLQKVIDFVNKCAFERLGRGGGAIEDVEVFGWVVHYVQDEKVEIPTEEKLVLTEEDKEEAKKRALAQFEEEQLQKLRDAEEKKQKALEKKIAKEDKKREESGQMSLFDFGDEDEKH